jgi:hypothetical protein
MRALMLVILFGGIFFNGQSMMQEHRQQATWDDNSTP